MSSLRNQIKQNACYLEVRNIYWKRLLADTYIERNKRFHLLNETKCKFHVISLFEHFKKNYCISSMLQCKKFWCSSCHIGLNNRIEIYSGLTRTHLMSLSIISKRDEKVLKRFIKRTEKPWLETLKLLPLPRFSELDSKYFTYLTDIWNISDNITLSYWKTYDYKFDVWAAVSSHLKSSGKIKANSKSQSN